MPPPDTSLPSSGRRVIVIGGGLAGMAAAAALESAGAAVTLLEASGRLGGRASSFQDPQTGEELDNCQHVLLGCCTNLIDFYHRLGAADLIRYERQINFIDERGRIFGLWVARSLPAPLHLAPALMRFGALPLEHRVALVRAMTTMMSLGRDGAAALADRPFGDWLDEQSQPAELVARFYDPILISALNEESRRASSTYAIQVFQEALLRNSAGYVMGLPACPLSRLYGKSPCRDVRLGARVAELRFDGGRIQGVQLADSQTIDADAVILATNYHAALRLVPAELSSRDNRFAHLEKLESVPILGAHLWFDRPVLRTSHAAFLQGPLQWLFRKDADGRAVHGVISAARAWAGETKDKCLELFESQIRATLPMARDAQLQRGVIIVEKRATFSPSPGVDRLRPAQAPGPRGIANLFLAGDYTQTGWPATMEGAVRSGYLAAEAALAAWSRPQRLLVGDLPAQWPWRLLAH